MIPCPSPAHRAVIALVRASCGIAPGSDDIADLEATAAEQIVSIASAHTILNLIAVGIERYSSLARHLPADALIFCSEMLAANRRRNRAIADQITQLATLMHQAGVEAVLLKGGCELIAPSYRDPGLRFIGDVDLLIDEAQLRQAETLLLESGCEQAPMAPINAATHHHLPSLARADWPAPVELHRAIAQGAGGALLAADTILADARATDLPALRVPCLADRLTHLVVHAQIGDQRPGEATLLLRDAVDLFEISRKLTPPDWDRAAERFQKHGRSTAFAGLLAATEAILPGHMPGRHIDPAGRAWAGEALDLMGRPGKRRLAETLRWAAWYLKMLATDPDRRRHYIERLSTPGELARVLRFHKDRNSKIR